MRAILSNKSYTPEQMDSSKTYWEEKTGKICFVESAVVKMQKYFS